MFFALSLAIMGRKAPKRHKSHRDSCRSTRKGALTDSGGLRRENEVLRERVSTLSAAILRISVVAAT